MDDATTCAHPNRIACCEVARVAIVERTLEDQRHGLEASVGMRPADSATRFEVEAIILEQDEGIARVKCRGLTLDTTPLTLTRARLVPALVYQSYTSNIAVLTNANSGYTLTVFDNPTAFYNVSARNCTIPKVSASMSGAVAWPGAPAGQTGYTVRGNDILGAPLEIGRATALWKSVADVNFRAEEGCTCLLPGPDHQHRPMYLGGSGGEHIRAMLRGRP